MKKNEQLFFLIKSLTKSEKRYFKLLTTINGENNNYLKLFDAIEAQEKYDEAWIKKKFEKERFTNQLTTAKNYLRNLLLKSLRMYHSDISNDAKAKASLLNAEILYQKGLYALSRFEAQKAQKISDEYDILSVKYEALTWQKRIIQAEDPRQIEKLKEIGENLLQVSSQINEYAHVWKSNISGEALEGSFQEINESDPLPLVMMQRLLNFQMNLYQENSRGAILELEKIVEKYDEFTHRKMEEAETYMVILNNLIAFYVFEKRHPDALLLISRAKQFINGLKTIGAPAFKTLLRTYNIELEIYREQKDFEMGEKLIDEINRSIEYYSLPVPISYKLSFWFQFAYLFFIGRKYSESLKWINILLGYRSTELREDLITYAHWLNLMVHFELKNYFVLRYFVDSTKRYLSKRRNINSYEKLLLNLFIRIARSPETELRTIFRGCYKKLMEEKNVIPSDVIDYVDFYRWMEGKMK